MVGKDSLTLTGPRVGAARAAFSLPLALALPLTLALALPGVHAVILPSVVPAVMFRILAVPSAPTTYTNALCEFR
jgi:hypothetical protein